MADWIDHLCAVDGEPAVARYRTEARAMATALGVSAAQAAELDELIGAALGTRPAAGTPALRARGRGLAYDQARVRRFDLLVQALRGRTLTEVPDLTEDAGRGRYLPFYEAYFSNFIEGTEFTVDEARRIVDDEIVPVDRTADGHDVLGTYRVLADHDALSERPDTATAFLECLQRWHRAIMSAGPQSAPVPATSSTAANAFVEATDAERRGIHLRMPGR